MFYGCTALTSAPILNAATLTNYCYHQMFNGCSKLNYVEMYATNISASSCLTNWLSGVSSTGTFIKHRTMTSLPRSASGIPTGWTVYDDSMSSYFTIVAKEDGLTAKLSQTASSYRIDGGSWTSLAANTATPSVSSGKKIQFKINNPTIQSATGIGTFIVNKKFDVEGNVMSLLYGDSFKTQKSLAEKAFAFYYLLQNCTTLQSAEYLCLPATTLGNYCYQNMFDGCTSLTKVPTLPATTLADYCYNYMFSGCTSLTSAPALPATTLATYCYQYMFSGCTSLTSAPALQATTLKNYCYGHMFNGCTALKTCPTLPATTLASYCYDSMFYGCTSLTTTVALPATTLATYCYQYMFYGCTSLTSTNSLPATTLANYCYYNMYRECVLLASAPALPATTLKNYCYAYMFYNCKKITSAPALNATTLQTACYQYMFKGCTALKSAPSLPATTLATNCYQYMFQGCTSLTAASALPATTLTSYCYSNMYDGCTSLTTTPVISATTLATYCCQNMFQGCTKITSASTLSATTLVDYCYQYMFKNCTALTTAPTIKATTLATYCCREMFRGCTALTSAPTLNAATLTNYCYQNMFYGCTVLKYAEMYATNISASNCLSNWLYGVASSGTLVKDPDMTSLPRSASGIPTGWNFENRSVDYSQRYFTIVAKEDGLTAKLSGVTQNSLYYRVNGGSWTSLSADSTTQSINYGQNVQFKITSPSIKYTTPSASTGFAGIDGIGTFFVDKKYIVEGNVMSLLYGDNFASKTATDQIIGWGHFARLFDTRTGGATTIKGVSNTNLQSVKNLILPATTLTAYCYFAMFGDCVSLVDAPVLPATILTKGCYLSMFDNCTSLTSAPALPATSLEEICYFEMFAECKSLTTAPSLPAKTLKQECYAYMFDGCTALTTAPALPSTSLANYCYSHMFDGCTSLTTAPNLPASGLSLTIGCYEYMFRDCTSLTTAPVLNAKNAPSKCYFNMFSGCNKLKYIKMLAITYASDSFQNFITNEGGGGTFVQSVICAGTKNKLPMNVVPIDWSVKNNCYTPSVINRSGVSFTFNTSSGVYTPPTDNTPMYGWNSAKILSLSPDCPIRVTLVYNGSGNTSTASDDGVIVKENMVWPNGLTLNELLTDTYWYGDELSDYATDVQRIVIIVNEATVDVTEDDYYGYY